MANEKKKYLDLDGLEYYHSKLQQQVDAIDEKLDNSKLTWGELGGENNG